MIAEDKDAHVPSGYCNYDEGYMVSMYMLYMYVVARCFTKCSSVQCCVHVLGFQVHIHHVAMLCREVCMHRVYSVYTLSFQHGDKVIQMTREEIAMVEERYFDTEDASRGLFRQCKYAEVTVYLAHCVSVHVHVMSCSHHRFYLDKYLEIGNPMTVRKILSLILTHALDDSLFCTTMYECLWVCMCIQYDVTVKPASFITDTIFI